jgi:hypothetical protein
MPRTENIRRFISLHYTDQRLAEVYAHCCDGRLSYASCCCLIGAANSPHPLRGPSLVSLLIDGHLKQARALHFAAAAEREYYRLGMSGLRWLMIRMLRPWVPRKIAWRMVSNFDDDAQRRKLLRPILEAEMRHRELQRGIENSLRRNQRGIKIGVSCGEPVRVFPAPHDFLH